METPTFFALISNTAPKHHALITEALLLEFPEANVGKPVLIIQDPSVVFRFRAGRTYREDPVARYGNLLGESAIPLFRAQESLEFLEDAMKGRNAHLSKGRSFVCVMREVTAPDVMSLFDAICFSVTMDPSSNAFVYAGIRSLLLAGRDMPIHILVTGEPRIERCAEFFTTLVAEINSLSSGTPEITFAGNIFIDQEETELAGAFGLSVAAAFPGGVLRGQARRAARRLFSIDPSNTNMAPPERLQLLYKHLKSPRS